MVVKGKQLTLKEHFQKLRQELRGMTFREKLEHLWEYYKWVLLVLAGVVMLVAVVISSIKSMNTEIRLAGALVNVDVSLDGYVWLQDGYAEHAGVVEGEETVDLNNMQFENPFTTTDQTYALDVQESIIALISGKQLDYLMLDELAMPFFLDPETMMDLRELFSQEELAAMGNAVIKLELEDGTQIPMAIEISDTFFGQEYLDSTGPIYLTFAINTPRKEACRDFWLYIKGGQTETLTTELAGSVVDAAVSADGQSYLSDGFFEAQGYVLGDQRVELSSQSIVEQETDEEGTAQLVLDNLLTTLEKGTLDYVLCDENGLQALHSGALLDLTQLLTPEQLESLAGSLVYEKEIPVAVDISQLPFAKKHLVGGEPVYLAFSANTTHMEACKALWGSILETQ